MLQDSFTHNNNSQSQVQLFPDLWQPLHPAMAASLFNPLHSPQQLCPAYYSGPRTFSGSNMLGHDDVKGLGALASHQGNQGAPSGGNQNQYPNMSAPIGNPYSYYPHITCRTSTMAHHRPLDTVNMERSSRMRCRP